MTPELNSIGPCRLGKRFKSKVTKVGFARSPCLSAVVFLLILNVIAEGAPDKTVYIGEEIQFTNKTKGPPGMKWKWNFDEKNPKSSAGSTDKEPTHIYKEPGTKVASLTVVVPGVRELEPQTQTLEIEVKPVTAKPEAANKTPYIGACICFVTHPCL